MILLTRNYLPGNLFKDTTGKFTGGDQIPAGKFQYLIPKDRARLNNMISAGHIDKLGDALYQEYQNNWSKDPAAMDGKDWYNNMTQKIGKAFKDPVLFAKLLGATSPVQKVKPNFFQALEAYNNHMAGKYDSNIAAYGKNGYSDDIAPRMNNGGLFGLNSDKVLKVLAGEDVGGPKVRNFTGNLAGTSQEATIDRWATRTMARLSGMPLENLRKVDAATDLDYAASEMAFRKAADRIGLKPQELQAIGWMGEKKLWESNKWTPIDKNPTYEPFLDQHMKLK